jgi:hypothetical protein
VLFLQTQPWRRDSLLKPYLLKENYAIKTLEFLRSREVRSMLSLLVVK